MKIETQQVLLHFLQRYESLLTTNVKDEIDPFFHYFFLKQELIEILKLKLKLNKQEEKDLSRKSKLELLAMINDDVYILKYYLEKLKVTLFKDAVITNDIVWKRLVQLSQFTHYLASKDVTTWDEYDYANYRAMSHKAGTIKYIYGMYDIAISQEDVGYVTSLPKRFYETEELAKQGLIESNNKDSDAHILYLLIANP